MDPPSKRPRLSVIPNDTPPDALLSQARYRNDLGLKASLEAIFEKYSQDFSGVGDEIDLATGEIMVDNGHLKSMNGEADPGMPSTHTTHQKSPMNQVTGGSLLKAFAGAPEDENEDPSYEDVEDDAIIMSIEDMAQNAATYSDPIELDSDEESYRRDDSMESEADELGQPDDSVKIKKEDEEEYWDNDNSRATKSQESPDTLFGGSQRSGSSESLFGGVAPVRSPSHDSLFDRVESIPGSPDSLFGNGDDRRNPTPNSSFSSDPYRAFTSPTIPRYSFNEPQELELSQVDDVSGNYLHLADGVGDLSNEAILSKFGTEIGPQVLEVLQKRHQEKEAHIEPAWRVPDIGNVFHVPTAPSPTVKSRTPAPLPRPILHKNNHKSVWGEEQPPELRLHRLNQPKFPLKRRLSLLSTESDDPLQEGFEAAEEPDTAGEESFEDFDDGFYEVDLEELNDAICPFCHKKFSVRGSVYVHWDELIKKDEKDGIHDMDYLRDIRGRKRRRTQIPKITIEDYHTMIKLHEVDKMDWREMNENGLFDGRPASSLQTIYYQYRTISKTDKDLADEGRSWQPDEDKRLLELSNVPDTTITKIRRSMKTRTQAEIGNRLAALWMQEYIDQGIATVDPRIKRNYNYVTIKLPSTSVERSISSQPRDERSNSSTGTIPAE